MKSAAAYAGDPRHHHNDIERLRTEVQSAYDRGHFDGYEKGHAAGSVGVADEAVRQMKLLRRAVEPMDADERANP